jgi:hypothetical protein
MENHKITIHFRYGNFEKDFEDINVLAENDDQAIELAKKHRRFVFKCEIISRDEM